MLVGRMLEHLVSLPGIPWYMACEIQRGTDLPDELLLTIASVLPGFWLALGGNSEGCQSCAMPAVWAMYRNAWKKFSVSMSIHTQAADIAAQVQIERS